MRAYSGAMSNTETAQPISTRPLIEVQAAAACLSQLPIAEDVAEMFRCAMRRQELGGLLGAAVPRR